MKEKQRILQDLDNPLPNRTTAISQTNRLYYTANDLAVESTDYICVKNPLTDASEFSRFPSVIFYKKLFAETGIIWHCFSRS